MAVALLHPALHGVKREDLPQHHQHRGKQAKSLKDDHLHPPPAVVAGVCVVIWETYGARARLNGDYAEGGSDRDRSEDEDGD